MPFCETALSVRKWGSSADCTEPRTLGEHLRRQRLELGLLQRELADQLEVDPATLRNWELGRTEPDLSRFPRLLRFLGFDPRPAPQSLAERLVSHRRGRGRTQAELAAELGVDPSTLAGWEAGRMLPKERRTRGALSRLLKAVSRGEQSGESE